MDTLPFVYMRKSSRREEMQAPSLPRQRAELIAFSKRDKFTLGKEFGEKQSAKEPGRPVFNEMLRRIEAGESSVIVTWHPDRLARNAMDGARIIELLEKGKLRTIKFASYWFENTPQGRFMLMIAFAQSAHYSDALSVNTRSGLDRKVARGEFPGLARVGYLNDRRKKRIVIDRARAPIIREAFERYATGSDNIDDIRAFLFSRGVGTADAKRPMCRIIAGRLLSDPIYYGTFRWKGELHRGVHEPIISKALYDRVQAVREKRVRFHPAAGRTPKPMAFRRTLTCKTCISCVTAEVQKGLTYYHCSRKRKCAVRCREPYIREEALDLQIISLLKPYTFKTEWADEMLRRIEAERATAWEDTQEIIENNCKEIDAVNASLLVVQDGLVDGILTNEYARDKKAKLLRIRYELEAKNDRLNSDATSWLEPFREFVSTARTIAETCARGTKEARAELARKIFGSNLVLSGRKASGVAVNPWPVFADNGLPHGLVPLYNAARTYFLQDAGRDGATIAGGTASTFPRIEPGA